MRRPRDSVYLKYGVRIGAQEDVVMAPVSKGARKSAKRGSATGKKSKGFSDEEKAAMRESVQER